MNLKNYTSSVPVDITLARIERLLVDSGATGIAKEYKAGKVQSLVSAQWNTPRNGKALRRTLLPRMV